MAVPIPARPVPELQVSVRTSSKCLDGATPMTKALTNTAYQNKGGNNQTGVHPCPDKCEHSLYVLQDPSGQCPSIPLVEATSLDYVWALSKWRRWRILSECPKSAYSHRFSLGRLRQCNT